MSEKRFIVESVMIDCLCEDEPRIAKVITDTDETYSYEDLYEVAELLNEQQSTIEHLRKQIQIYEQLISNSYVGEEETLDGFVGKYVIWENELQKYRKKNKNEMIDDE